MHYLWSTISSIAIMASMTFSSNKSRNDVAELATRWLSVLLDIQLTLFADTWGAALTEIFWLKNCYLFKKLFYLMIWFINKTIKVTYLSCWNSDLQYVHLTTGNDPLHSLHNCCPCDSSSNGWRLKHLLQANKATPGGRPWFTPEAAILITVSIPLVRGWSRYRNIRTKSWKILEMWNCSYTYLTIHDNKTLCFIDNFKWQLCLNIFRTFEYLVW